MFHTLHTHTLSETNVCVLTELLSGEKLILKQLSHKHKHVFIRGVNISAQMNESARKCAKIIF